MSMVEVKVPDIGDFKEVEVIELLVKAGDTVKVDQSLITVESDKASMEIPSSQAGVIKEIKIKVGDKVAEGSVLLLLEAAAAVADAAAPAAAAAPSAGASVAQAPAAATAPTANATASGSPALTLVESRPAAASAPAAVSTGYGGGGGPVAPGATGAAAASGVPGATAAAGSGPSTGANVVPHASPSIRKFSRELGVDLVRVAGTGPKGRITQQDVQNYVKQLIVDGASGSASAGAAKAPAKSGGSGVGLDLLPWPSLDFSKFGATELQPLSRIKKISGPNLHRNWVMIPHVTQYDEADVTELEEFRKTSNAAMAKSGIKLTMLAFVIKACVSALKKYPAFNSSLDAEGANLILKQYYNIGFAADTPNGLVVPVVKNADQKGIVQIAQEMGEMSAQARDGKLKPADMQGASFTISSLGGIGGTAFTPIINAPEVAILGLSKTAIKPVWDGKAFQPRLMMPMSLSYDHRVVDGAMGARFSVYLAEVLGDMRKTLL
ncbi:MAG: dihydrolipoyllysine-residue acetyltransferase [Herminiimonas sp.]|nr:dihydrolipoyllysine-residue acetyltransferase [Herminiimonas sp.]